MIVLPTEKRKITHVIEPKKMLIFGSVKVGKTSSVAQLPNSLIIDLESGSNYFECASIDIKDEALKNGVHYINYFKGVAEEIKKANIAAGKKVYDFIILDSLSVLEDMADQLATAEYKKTVQGKSFIGESVITGLSKGAGWALARESMDKLLNIYENLAGKCLIYLGHQKAASLDKAGDSLQVRDLSLSGKSKLVLTSQTDLNGIFYRDKSSKKNILSFVSEETDLVTGSRIPHLANKKIVISEMGEDGLLKTHWNTIFPSIDVK